MPKPSQIQVQPSKPLNQGQAYRCQVIAISKTKAPKGLRVRLLNMDRTQAGRRHDIQLPDLHEESVTAEFFRACGCHIAVGAQVNPQSTIGRVIRVRFLLDEENVHQAVSFARDKELKADDAGAPG